MAIDLTKHIRLALLRGSHYVSLRSGSVLRWAAKQVPTGKDYHTLTTTLWRKVGLEGTPVGAGNGVTPGSTYYFEDPVAAEVAAMVFLTALRERDVKL